MYPEGSALCISSRPRIFVIQVRNGGCYAQLLPKSIIYLNVRIFLLRFAASGPDARRG